MVQPTLRSVGAIAPKSDPLRVIYVAGLGRSGSTVLAAILGNHPEMFAAGELCNLPHLGWVNDEYCACGNRPSECTFWQQVRRQWSRRVGADDPAKLAALARQFEVPKGWQGRPRRENGASSPPFRAYAGQTLALLEAIRQTSGRPIIVDASKSIWRAQALCSIPGIDLRVIHLVRDGRGVAWSLKKRLTKDPKAGVVNPKKPRKAWRSAVSWIRVNLRIESLLNRSPVKRFVRVRYEDCVSDPGGVLEQIGRLAEVDLAGLARAVHAGQPLDMGHMIAGNRLRMAGQVRLRLDGEWVQKMSRLDRWVCWVMSGWLLKRYGYQRRAA
jgi:hypothetical protein